MSKVTFSSESTLKFFNLTVIDKYLPKLIFINANTGGLMIVHEGSLYHKLLTDDQEGIKSINDFLNKYSDYPQETLISYLRTVIQKGLISIDNYLNSTASSEHNYERFLVQNERKIGLCIFHIHNYCNLACSYCYLAETGIKKTIKLETMLETAEKIYQSGSKYINFEFHGGEPTMSMGIITKFVNEVKAKYKDKFDSISFSIQTNAYLLKDEHIDFFAKHKFKIRVSIDGTKENHDAYRVTHSGRKTFDNIVLNIEKMLNKGLFVEACAVIHSRNLHELEHMYTTLKSTGVNGIRFLPVFKVTELDQDYYLDGEEYFNSVFSFIEKMYKESKESINILSNMMIGEFNAIQSFDRTYMCLKSSCGAGNEMIALDVDGEVYPCEEMIDMPEFYLGNVHDMSFNNIKEYPIVKEIHNRTTSSILQCSTCEWREMCHAGCPKKSYNVFGNLNSPSEMCSYYKSMFPALVNLLYDSKEKDGLYAITK